MRETLSEIARNMLEKDVLEIAEEGHFKGETHVYEETESGLLIAKTFHFDVRPATHLDPFGYIRHIEDPDKPFDSPIATNFDEDLRIDYYPLLILNKVRRPDHMHETDNGLVTAVKGLEGKGDSWFIRYFPSKNIDKTVMDQARHILNPQPEIPLP